MKCSICGKEIKGYECNAWPLNNGECCQECDNKYVIPLRLFLMGKSKNQVLIVKSNNTIEFMSVDKELTLKQAQDAVEGYIELVPVKDPNFFFIVNEEGLLKDLAQNSLAKSLFGLNLVGNLVVCPKGLFN